MKHVFCPNCHRYTPIVGGTISSADTSDVKVDVTCTHCKVSVRVLIYAANVLPFRFEVTVVHG